MIPYAKPLVDSDDRRLVREVLSSGWLTSGKVAKLFEDELARYHHADAVLSLSSCTAALHLALELAGVAGKYVIVPSLTFTATAAAVLMARGIPIIADVDPNTLTLSPEQCELAVSRFLGTSHEHVAAALPVHYGGNPSKFRSMLAWGRELNVTIIDDAAHVLPAFVDGEMIGSHQLAAFATCLSFYPTKPITTGEGGALLLNGEQAQEHLARATQMSLHGIDADAYQRSRTGLYHYKVTEMGWKYNMPDLLAALGRGQLKKAESFWIRRKLIAETYNKRLQTLVQDGRLNLPIVDDGCESSWHLYAIRFPYGCWKSGWSRDRAAARLKELGIGTSMHYVPLHRQPFWQAYMPLDSRCPNAEAAYSELLSLPIWAGMSERDIDEVVARLGQVCDEGMD